MNPETEQKILNLYPEYSKVFGPYNNSNDGRARVVLYNNENQTRTTRQFAKVLLEVKINRRLTGDETVDHEDNNKYNDASNNIRVLPRSMNASLASKGNKRSLGFKQTPDQKRNGEKNGKAFLTNEQVRKYRDDVAEGVVNKSTIIEQTGLSDRSVRNMLNGKSYTDAGGTIIKPMGVGRPKQNK